MNVSMNKSMAMRIMLPLGLALAVLIAGAGFAMYHGLAASYDDLIDARLKARISMLMTALEYDDGELEFEIEDSMATHVPEMAEYWSIKEKDGRVLWQSETPAASVAGPVRSHLMEMQVPQAQKVIQCEAATGTSVEEAGLLQAQIMLGGGLPLLYLALMLFVFVIVRRELRPLEDIAAQARAVDPQDAAAGLFFVADRKQAGEIQTLNQALAEMLQRLQEGLQRERQFSAAAAHELRTPVAQLMSSLEIALRKERDHATYRAVIEDALTDCRRLSDLIAALLMLNNKLAEEVKERLSLDALLVLLRGLGINALHDDGLNKQALIPGNEQLLTMLLGNMIDNARRYAGDDPVVRLEARGAVLVIAVADNGPGVPQPEQERIFQPLVRLDVARTIKDEDSGFGMGLAIVAAVVSKLHGRICCMDNPGGGALFEIELPLQAENKI